MYEVSFWKNGCQMTTEEAFETFEDAKWYAEQGFIGAQEAEIFNTETEEIADVITF